MNSDRSGRPAGGPFDEAADITQEFWGTTRGWVPRRPDEGDDDTAGTRRARRGGLSGLRARQSDRVASRTGRTRQHGVVRPSDAAPPPQPARDELADGWPLDDWTDDWTSDDWATAHAYQVHDHGHDDRVVDRYDAALDEQRPAAREVPLTPSRQVAPLAERLGVGAVDPLLLRLGVMVLIGVLMAPLALALRSDDGSGAIRTAPVVAAAYGSTIAGPTQTAPTAETVATEPAVTEVAGTPEPSASTADVAGTAASAASTEAPAAPSTTAAEAPATTSTEAPVTMAADQDTSESVEPAVATEQAERIVPACPQQYEASPGDSWYRIAEAAGVSPGELFTENGANAQTVILPGDSICLPAGATMPAPLAPPTTQAPATTAPATTPPTTVASAPPTTEAPPASTVPPSKSEVEQIIRDVWPDELEDKALEVAWRESKYQPGAYNGWCCYGLFQIHWGAHKGWLATIGIDSTADLLDARRNTEVAYLIYQRSGGWGPWGG